MYTRHVSSSKCFTELDSVASPFRKSASENCAIDLAQRKLEVFPDRNNVYFFGRSFHRFSITMRSITRRNGPLSFDVAVVLVVIVAVVFHCTYYCALVEKVRVQRERGIGIMLIDEKALRVK